MKWLINGHRSEQKQLLRDMTAGHEGKRRVIIGDPKPGKYTVDDLKNTGYLGYYEVARCQCDLCREIRREEYYKPLEDWRKMNKQILEEKAKKSREPQIRRANKCPPKTYRIVLDKASDLVVRKDLATFVGHVIAEAEFSRMLRYAMRIEWSESDDAIYYDLIMDTDVSTTIEIALGEFMGTVFSLAEKTGLIGHGLNIIKMDVRK